MPSTALWLPMRNWTSYLEKLNSSRNKGVIDNKGDVNDVPILPPGSAPQIKPSKWFHGKKYFSLPLGSTADAERFRKHLLVQRVRMQLWRISVVAVQLDCFFITPLVSSKWFRTSIFKKMGFASFFLPVSFSLITSLELCHSFALFAHFSESFLS